MFKFLLVYLLSVGVLFAADKVEVFATQLDSNVTHMHAYGDVVVLYKGHYLSANEAYYNRDSGDLELHGNITAIEGDKYVALGEHAKLNIKAKERTFTPFYLVDKDSKLWMTSGKVHATETKFDLHSGRISGCNPNDPLWHIDFSSSDYDSESKWMNVYNARLYIDDIPVFYFPYFGYSLDETRRSGLLMPSFGVSSNEGLYYQQPIYIATQDEWDLELRPQTRSERGSGIYATLRFADSKVSKGSVTLGYFEERESYVNEFDLANQKHYGGSLKYENSDFLKQWFGVDAKGQSGIYSDVTLMNDVDYINLSENDETKNATSNQIFSRINLFYNEEDNYLGTYFKYFQDLSQESNDGTIQKLPIVQYHHYLQNFFNDHLYYNVDIKSTNYYRKVGKTAIETNLNIPITLQTSLFDEYLDVSYQADLKGTHIDFSGSNSGTGTYSDINNSSGLNGRVSNNFAVSTHLSRGYEGYVHAIAFGVSYTDPGVNYKSGYFEDEEDICSSGALTATGECDYYNLNEPQRLTKLEFTQFIFDDKGTQKLYNRLSQNFSHDNKADVYGEIENELEVAFTDKISFYDNTFYNHSRKVLRKTLNTLRYNDESYNVGFSHLFEDKADGINTSYLTVDAAYRYNKHYSYLARYAYDIESEQKKSAEIGFLYSKRCWDFGLRYVENNRPILTQSGTNNSVYDRYIYFTIILKPIGGSEINYKLPAEG